MDAIINRVKIPALVGLGFLGFAYFLRSSSYVTPENIKQTLPLRSQRLANLKTAMILALAVFVVTMVLYKRKEEDEKIMVGSAPF